MFLLTHNLCIKNISNTPKHHPASHFDAPKKINLLIKCFELIFLKFDPLKKFDFQNSDGHN